MLGLSKNIGFRVRNRKNTDVKCRYFEARALYHLVNELDLFLDGEGIHSNQILSWEIIQDLKSGLFLGVLLYV